MKLKSNKSAAKRFRKTGTGKIVARKSCRGHLLLQKSRAQKKLANKPKILQPSESKRVARLLPNL
jgi:large subunit ribosomal protein L35